MIVNGKEYPMWSQFVEKKEEWIDGGLQDLDTTFGDIPETTITDIQLLPNGKDSAMFEVVGEDYSCAFDVQYGGITAGEDGWITFSGYGGHTWRIKKK